MARTIVEDTELTLGAAAKLLLRPSPCELRFPSDEEPAADDDFLPAKDDSGERDVCDVTSGCWVLRFSSRAPDGVDDVRGLARPIDSPSVVESTVATELMPPSPMSSSSSSSSGLLSMPPSSKKRIHFFFLLHSRHLLLSFVLVSFSFSLHVLHNCPWRTSQDTAACGVLFLSLPSRSTSLAPTGLAHATAGRVSG